MSRVRVLAFSVSLDGFSAGPNQALEHPLGVRGPELMAWVFPTRSFNAMHGQPGSEASGETGVDDGFVTRSFDNMGAWILGRHMFGPVRGPWPDESWRGWWGDEPPYHVPVFVLTHHPRPPLVMQGGTTFHFVTDGIDAALARAREAANGKDVRIGGGPSTVRQYLRAGLVDDLHLAVRPVLMGQGEPLFAGLDLHALGYDVVETVPGERATHMILRKRAS
ncbi:MAG: dihydrofolate reductase family protein [Vicinamibacterales bacterium]